MWVALDPRPNMKESNAEVRYQSVAKDEMGASGVHGIASTEIPAV